MSGLTFTGQQTAFIRLVVGKLQSLGYPIKVEQFTPGLVPEWYAPDDIYVVRVTNTMPFWEFVHSVYVTLWLKLPYKGGPLWYLFAPMFNVTPADVGPAVVVAPSTGIQTSLFESLDAATAEQSLGGSTSTGKKSNGKPALALVTGGGSHTDGAASNATTTQTIPVGPYASTPDKPTKKQKELKPQTISGVDEIEPFPGFVWVRDTKMQLDKRCVYKVDYRDSQSEVIVWSSTLQCWITQGGEVAKLIGICSLNEL